MDDIIEFIVEVILEGLMEIMMSNKAPFIVRFILYVVSSAFLLFIAGLLFKSAFSAEALWYIILLLLGFVMVALWMKLTYEIFKHKFGR